MRRLPSRVVRGVAVALAVWILAGVIMWKFPPGTWWMEMIVVTLVWVGLFIGGTWIIGRKKWGLVASFGVTGLLLMNRLNILDWPMLGLWLLVLGVASLVN